MLPTANGPALITVIVGNCRRALSSRAEVWKPGTYNYRHAAGGDVVHVRVEQGPLGLQVAFPGKDAVPIETLKGTFDGPITVSG